MPLRNGQILLGRYHISRLISQNNLDSVWLADDISGAGRRVVLKEPREHLSETELEAVQHAYEQEVRIYTELLKEDAPHIVPIHRVESYEDRLLLVMAEMSGRDLTKLLQECPAGLPIHRAEEITVAILKALFAAQEHPWRLVHRNIKPANILFDAGGVAYLADFGLAQLTGMASDSPSQGTGSPEPNMYMPPEQLRGDIDLSPSVDIYALGCVLFEMLTGKRYKLVLLADKLPSRLRPEVPARLDQILARSVAEDPQARYQSAQEMYHDLTGRTLFTRREETEPLPAQAPVDSSPISGRKWALLGFLSAVLLFVILAALWLAGLLPIAALPTAAVDPPVSLAIGAELSVPDGEQTTAAGDLGGISQPIAADGQTRDLSPETGPENRTQSDRIELTLTENTLLGRGRIEQLAYAPDGGLLAVASSVGVWLFHSTSPNGSRLLSHPSTVMAVAWSPDGRWVASGADDHGVRIWDVASGELLRQLHGHTGPVTSLTWSPDGTLVASGSQDRSVRIWAAETGDSRPALEGHTAAVSALAWSPDGTRLASGSADRSVRIWDAQAGRLLRALERHEDGVVSVAWSPNGARLASQSQDGTVRLWETTLGVPLQVLDETDNAAGVAWSPDNSQLAFAAENTVRIWNLAENIQVAVLEGHSGTVTKLAWSPDGSQLASAADASEAVLVWDLQNVETANLLHTIAGYMAWTQAVSFAPQGNRLAFAANDRTVRVFNTQDWQPQLAIDNASNAYCLAWSADGTLLATGAEDSTVRIWDAHTGAPRLSLRGHTGAVHAVAWSPDGQRLISGAADSTLRVWDPQNGELLQVIGNGPSSAIDLHLGSVRSVAWSPDGAQFASGTEDSTVRTWDAATGELNLILAGHTGAVNVAAWSPEGTRLASAADDNTVRIWDASTGAQISLLSGHTGAVQGLAWSADGDWIASGSADHTVRAWNTQTGKQNLILAGHVGAVNAVSWAAKDDLLATSSEDGTVYLWTLERQP